MYNLTAFCLTFLVVTSAYAVERPRFSIDTEKAYDPSQVPAFKGEHTEIYLVEPADNVPVAGLAEIEKACVDLLYALSNR